VHVAVLLLIVFFLYLSLRHGRVLFRIDVRGGRAEVTRGHVPQALLNAFGDVLRNVYSGEISARRTTGGAQLDISGSIDDRTAQRLRNVFSLYPMSQLTAPPVETKDAVNTALTASWLLSLFRR
jgi:hypothetical protein